MSIITESTPLEEGTAIGEILPDYEGMISSLNDQRKKYEVNEREAQLGPEPTRPSYAMSENEMFQIKKASRVPYGATIVRNLNKGFDVLSMVDAETGEESEYFETIWKAVLGDKKLLTALPDYRIGGVAIFELRGAYGRAPEILVRSPKNVTVFFDDIVNDIWGIAAIERFSSMGVNYLRFWDNENILTFREAKGDAKWTLMAAEKHQMKRCPIIAIPNIVTSDGVIYGNLDFLGPALKTARMRANMLSQAGYWSSSRTTVIENLDLDDTVTDPNTGETMTIAEKVERNIRMTENGMILLPSAGNGGAGPSLKQTDASDLIQLIEAKKDALRDLATSTGLPKHIIEGTDVPSTAEGSIQAYNSHNDDKEKDKANLGLYLSEMMEQLALVCFGEEVKLRIIWGLSEKISLNSMADTVSKLVSGGFPASWVAKTILRGFRPTELDELIGLLEERDSMAAEQMQLMTRGMGGM